MAKVLRIAVEVGPRGKKFAAIAPDWPGLERGAASEDAAIDRLRSYLSRYADIAQLAKLDEEFAASTNIRVVERYPGTGSTDFWGVSFGFTKFDEKKMTGEQLHRELTLMRACWTYFDAVRAGVSAEMKRGPRGGGRDRDRIVRHTLGAEQDWAKKIGIRVPPDSVVTETEGLTAFRDEYCSAIREFYSDGKLARSWPLRYLIRHTAYHTLDHAWEMADKDCTTDNTSDSTRD
jgi:hypothetical protein